MAWIEVHQSLSRHRKTLIASRKLGISTAHMVGLMVNLWLWALDNAPDGDITDSSLIAIAAGWEGDEGEFLTALYESGFIFCDDDGDCIIPNWNDYAGKLLSRRKANAERMRAARAEHVRNTSTARAQNVLSDSTVQNSTQPNSTKGPRSRASAVDDGYIEELVGEFGPKVGEQRVRDSISRALNHVASKRWIDKRRGLRDWVKRDAESAPNGHQPHMPINNMDIYKAEAARYNDA